MRHLSSVGPRALLAGMSVVLAAGLVAGCGSSSTSTTATAKGTTSGGAATVSTGTVAGIGTVLVNGQGRTLYMFVPDNRKSVTCTDACASVWPPVPLASDHSPTAGGQAHQSLIGSDPNPSGGRVATYAGWPLYTYVADTDAGTANGQALNLNGGLWYVLSPSGAIIKTKP